MTDKKDIKAEERAEIYRFSDYVLDAGRRELRKDGAEIELQPRVFDLLLFLVRHRDRAVDKDELMAAVWPGMVVTETALTRAVMKARKAVGDDASTQSVIKTLHGHGYRFVARLLETEAPAEVASPAVTPKFSRASMSTTDRKPWRHHLVPAAITALVVLLGFAFWYENSLEEGTPQSLRVAVLPVIDRTGNPDMSWARLGLMSFVSSQLSEESAIPTVADGSMLTLADDIAWDGAMTEEGARELLQRLGRLYGATHVLTMEMKPERTQLRMNYTLWNSSGKSSKGTMVGAEAPELARGVVQSLYGKLLRRSRLAGNEQQVSVDPFNNEAFARGMSLSLQGRCADAEQYFRVILDQEPELFAPRFELASCLRILGRPDEAEPMLSALVEEQRALGADHNLASAAMVLGVLYNRTGKLDQAEAIHQEALAAAISVQDHEQAGRILVNLAIVAKDRGERASSYDLLDRAVLEYRRGGREVLPGQVHSLQANLAMAQGRLAEADAYLRQAVEAFQSAGDRRSYAMMINNTGFLRRLQGRLEEAETYHLQSLAIREEIGDRVGVGRIHSLLAVVYTDSGRYADAREAALQAIAIASETGDRLFEGTSQAQLGDAERALGNNEAARQAYLRCRTILAEIHDDARVMQADLKLAAIDLEEGRVAEAVETVNRVLDSARERDALQPEIDAMEMLGDAAHVSGDSGKAETYFAAALERVRETSLDAKENQVLRKLAALKMERNDLAGAEPLVGALAGLEPNPAALMVQAKFAYLSVDYAAALKFARQARDLAGDAWQPSDEELLREYEEKSGAMKTE